MNEKIKQENSKALPKFIIILILATVFGAFVGGFSSHFQETLSLFFQNTIPSLLYAVSPFALPVSNILLLGAALILFLSCQSRFKNADLEDDLLFDKIEKSLNYPLVLSNIAFVMNFFFFSVGVLYAKTVSSVLITIVCFAVFAAITIFLQQKIIDFTKTLNPEKRGSVYDLHFEKKWEESCDEAQKLAIYKASYASYRFTSKTCIFLWMILQLLSFVIDIGILPIAIVLFIWLVQIISYSVSLK